MYGSFEIIEQLNDNDFKLNLPPYTRKYSMINVEKLKLFEPSMLDGTNEEQVLPTLEDFALKALEKLENTILQKKVPLSQI
jgi:hypothetical protein